MKVSKLASGLFAVLGSVLLIGSVVLCFRGMGTPNKGIQRPEEAERCAESLVNALNSGDLAGAAALLYGQPDLELDREPETEEGKQLWQAYCGSISAEAVDGCYTEGSEIFWSGTVTALDFSQTLEDLDSRASDGLKQKLESAEDPAQLLEEDGDVPQALAREIADAALTQVLADGKTVTRDVKVKLVSRDGSWWVVPDQALQAVLSGGLD